MPRAGTILFVVYATHAVAFEKALLFRGLLGPVAGSFLTDSPLVSTVNTTFKRNVVMWEHLRSEFSSQIICEANTLVEVVDAIVYSRCPQVVCTRGWAFAAGDAYTSLTFLGLSSKVSAKQRSSLGAGYEMHSIWIFFIGLRISKATCLSAGTHQFGTISRSHLVMIQFGIQSVIPYTAHTSKLHTSAHQRKC
jgi:hypothetical protein